MYVHTCMYIVLMCESERKIKGNKGGRVDSNLIVGSIHAQGKG